MKIVRHNVDEIKVFVHFGNIISPIDSGLSRGHGCGKKKSMRLEGFVQLPEQRYIVVFVSQIAGFAILISGCFGTRVFPKINMSL